MTHNLSLTIGWLARTPATLDALLRDLPDAWTGPTEREHTWTAFDVAGHPDSRERTDWMSPAQTILEFGDTRTFEHFDPRHPYQCLQGR